ncbi:MAG: penicillin-binding protein 2 [Rickettsiales bacterium]|jgi:cell division protein FtsI (penicillin-binding protein 3)|nr:penicillin-binding protein 2 [Rickettsiales bacterium]
MFNVGTDILQYGGTRGGTGAARSRLQIIYGLFVIAIIIFIARTLFLGIEGTDRTRTGVGNNSWGATRADIVDRNGDILAKNITSGHITLRPQKIADFDFAANTIHNIIPEISVADALNSIRGGRKFVYLKKYASDEQRAAVKASRIEGFEVEETERRLYPKRRLMSHIVGFVGNDLHGLEGIERTRDKYLSENSGALALSIDSRVQSVFYRELSGAMHKFGARAAMGMLMNSRTGEMIAMLSLPDFDPEDRNADSIQNRMFYPIRGVYEMGSVYKIFNTAMAIENGITKKYFVDEPYKIPDKFGRTATTIRDVQSLKKTTKLHPYMTPDEIMLYSCNVGSVQIARDLPSDAQPEFFERVNLDKPLSLEFGRTERPGMPRKWGPVERATVSFGHGISATPMHVLLAVNSVVTGFYVSPTILKRPVGKIYGRRVVSPEVSDEIRKIMLRISEVSGGKSARVAGINIGGKTATAEKRVGGKIDRSRNLTSFTAVFPIESPQYIMMVVLDEPQGIKETWGLRTASMNAAPTAGAIMDGIMPLLFQ